MRTKTFIVVLAVSVALALTGISQAASFTLTGNFLKVGISDNGAVITDGGGINNATGIQFDPSGTGTFPAAPPAPDFVVPQNAHEFLSVGVNNAFVTNGYFGAFANYTPHNPMGTGSSNTSVGTTLSANTVSGAFNLGGADLIYTQNVYFDTASSTINFSVIILNAGNTVANDVVFARGFDPDQPAYPSGLTVFRTTNSYPGAGVVRATDNLVTGWAIEIIDVSGGGKPQIMAAGSAPGSWDVNPYNIWNGVGAGAPGLADDSINIAYWIGTLNPHISKEIDFQYHVIPLPGSVLLLGTGLIGLLGIARRRHQK